jgi:FkbM family methyltransferase
METGSSVLAELTNVPREKIYLDMITLDQIAANHTELGQNILLKLDVQGYELEVLKGAEKVLQSTELVCMEVSLLNYNSGAPLMPEVIVQ